MSFSIWFPFRQNVQMSY